jgi:hypothetical protein
MTTATTFGREPIQIVNLEQPRCGRRFGVAPCTATGVPKCYNTWTTCQDVANISVTGMIGWRFTKDDVLAGGALDVGDLGLILTYSRSGETIRTNLIPGLVSVTGFTGRINVGAARDGESPFGVRSGVTVQLQDLPWDDHVGDYYLADRTGVRGTFWTKWNARNTYTANMLLRIYSGYKGQALSEMQQRLYLLDKVSGPDSAGRVTLTGIDPLRLADGKRAKFPRATDMRLVGAITNSQTTGIVINATTADISGAFGNTGSTRYLRIGSEIIAYTGYTSSGNDRTLTGVSRGVLGTVAGAAAASAAAQRVGRYSTIATWDALYDLLTVHTDLPASFINKPAWDAEGNTYLTGFEVSTTIHEPTPVEQLCGELMQQCSFYIWWDERGQTIRMKAVRPQTLIVRLTDDANAIAGTTEVTVDSEAWFTQLFIYYSQRDPTKGFDATNFERVRVRVNGDIEAAAAADTVRQKIVYSRWLQNDAQVQETLVRLMARYREPPRKLVQTLDAKDSALKVGDVATVLSRSIVDSEGIPAETVWQVISESEAVPGHSMRYELEAFIFEAARFGRYMAEGSPNYPDATPEEQFVGGWYTGEDGLMADGSDGYLYQ